MTENEKLETAIHCLAVQAEERFCEECPIYNEGGISCREVARDAIKALKEIQQYREIGTVEQVKNQKENLSVVYRIINDYRSIGTVEECREAMEKQKAKKPIPINYKKYADKIENMEFLEDAYLCPNCKTVIRSGSFCGRCGQKLNWNENSEGMEDK